MNRCNIYRPGNDLSVTATTPCYRSSAGGQMGSKIIVIRHVTRSAAGVTCLYSTLCALTHIALEI